MVDQKTSDTIKVNIKKRKRLAVFLIFLVFSTFLWLLIKLSTFYTLSFDIHLKIVDSPAEIWINEEASIHNLKAIINAKGFKLIKIYYFTKKPVEINLPLSVVPFRKQNQLTYYIKTLNIKEIVSAEFGISESEIDFAENEISFTVEKMISKMIPVSLIQDFHFKDQFGKYGDVTLEPETVEVFAPKDVLDTLSFILTEPVTKKNIESSFSGNAKLIFDNKFLKPLTTEVNYAVNVEKFTESKVKIRVKKPVRPQLKIFPDYVEIFYNVALKDFDKIIADDFSVEVDTAGLFERKQFLFIRVSNAPEETNISRISPDRIEYLILKK